MSALVDWGGQRRPAHRAWSIAALAIVMGFLLAMPAGRSAAATVRPLPSGVSTASSSWVVLPMGELSVQSNTFWQVFHSAPGSSQWSDVTPQGVADNGGLVAGAAAGSVLIGFLPSNLLRYSPLAVTANGGATWSPQLLPAGLRALPDGLAYDGAGPGGALAATEGGTVLAAPQSLSRWSPLISAAHLARLSRNCGVTSIDAVAIPSGSPLVATGCRRGGVVGIFTDTAGTWRPDGIPLSDQARSATAVLRLDASGATTTALVSASRSRYRALVALWRNSGAAWSPSGALTLSTRASVLASAVGDDGALAVLLGSPQTGAGVFMINPGGAWVRLPKPPAGTTAIALPSGPATVEGDAVDAFTVHGGSLGVYALTPSGTKWARVQSSQIALAYGSSG